MEGRGPVSGGQGQWLVQPPCRLGGPNGSPSRALRSCHAMPDTLHGPHAVALLWLTLAAPASAAASLGDLLRVIGQKPPPGGSRPLPPPPKPQPARGPRSPEQEVDLARVQDLVLGPRGESRPQEGARRAVGRGTRPRQSGPSPASIRRETSLIQDYGRASKWAEAVALLDANRPRQDAFMCTAAIDACGRGRQWRRALWVLAEMPSGGLEPTVRTFGAAVGACAKVTAIDGWRLALGLLRQTLRHGPEADAVLYSLCAGACQGAQNWGAVLALLGDLERGAAAPDLVACNSAITACGSGSSWPGALRLLRGLGRQWGLRPDVVSYSAAISACEKGDRWETSLELLAQMRQRPGCTEPNLLSYSAAISSCGWGGSWESALCLLRDMEQSALRPNTITLNAAVTACERAGQWERSLSLLSEMWGRRVSPDRVTYNAAITACGRFAEWERARALLGDMESAAIEPDVITYNALISAGEGLSLWREALGYMQTMARRRIAPSVITLNSAIAVCTQGAQWMWAWQLLDEAARLALQPDVVTYHSLISACEARLMKRSVSNMIFADNLPSGPHSGDA